MSEIGRIIDKYFDGDENKKKEVSEKMGMIYSTFARKTNLHDDRQLNVLDLIPYTINTDFSLLDHIENRLGRVAISLNCKNKPITMNTASTIAEQQGNALATLINALEDNKLDEDEKRALRLQYGRLAQCIHTVLQALN